MTGDMRYVRIGTICLVPCLQVGDRAGIGTIQGRKNFKPHPQNRILVAGSCVISKFPIIITLSYSRKRNTVTTAKSPGFKEKSKGDIKDQPSYTLWETTNLKSTVFQKINMLFEYFK